MTRAGYGRVMTEPTPSVALLADPSALAMSRHPEGGWFRETYRSPRSVDTPRGSRPLATSVLFLLLPAEVSAWHRVASDELWLWQGGGRVRLTVGGSGPAPAAERRSNWAQGSSTWCRPESGRPPHRPLPMPSSSAAWSPPASTSPTSAWPSRRPEPGQVTGTISAETSSPPSIRSRPMVPTGCRRRSVGEPGLNARWPRSSRPTGCASGRTRPAARPGTAGAAGPAGRRPGRCRAASPPAGRPARTPAPAARPRPPRPARRCCPAPPGPARKRPARPAPRRCRRRRHAGSASTPRSRRATSAGQRLPVPRARGCRRAQRRASHQSARATVRQSGQAAGSSHGNTQLLTRCAQLGADPSSGTWSRHAARARTIRRTDAIRCGDCAPGHG